ncbi:MAG: hypothetical protein BWZ10_01351 [candidate division BRC1 bacterium ADurb.BinA364]|nr:MAG: hypothetical protein BWZ10_01351 [candidate division BRC1 bacterium ADurb.BinA364]
MAARNARVSALSLIVLAAAVSARGADFSDRSSVRFGNVSVAVAPNYQSPTPHELALMAPVREEALATYTTAGAAKDQLRRIRECEKGVEESTGAEQERWQRALRDALANRDPEYLAYLEAERRLNEALDRVLAGMSQRERLLEPLMTSYVRVVPYILSRENTIPRYSEALEVYKKNYETNRSSTEKGEGEFAGLKAGVDPSWEKYHVLLNYIEKREKYPLGLLHAIAWRESEGDPQEGASNADERGLFQVQKTDYQPKFGNPLPEPAFSMWSQFETLSKWVPFNVALAVHSFNRLESQAVEYGFDEIEKHQLAYRFYNESSGYIFFCQHRLRIYREMFGLSPQDLSSTDIPTLDRFIYFREEEMLQQYDWEIAPGLKAGHALWEAWRNARFEVTSDLIWLMLEHRLTEMKQNFTLSVDEAGRRWCTVDLTNQSIKRRGTVGISGLHLTAIGICTARGVLPTAEVFHQYFGEPAL